MTTKLASIPLALMLAAAALLTSGSAVAQSAGRMGGGGGPMGGGAGLLPLMLRSAKLTPEQDAKVKELVAARRADQFLHLRVLRSEEHTSELQSPCNLVCRLLLEKKKTRAMLTWSIMATPCRPPSARHI